jgi:imidazolonepropionase-like amidohydrolase
VRKTAVALIAWLLNLPASAATDVLIRNATVYTMTARGVLPGMDLLIRDGRVTALGKDLPQPAGAELIDAAGRPVTPGLFGGVTQLGLRETDFAPAAQDDTLALGALRPEFDVAVAFNPASAAIAVNAVEGVTFAVLAPLAGGSIIAGQGAMAWMNGAPASATRALFVNLGGDSNTLSGGSRAAQFMLLRQALIEVRAPERLMPSDARLLTPAGRETLGRYVGSGRPVVFDVDRASDIRQALELMQEAKLRGVVAGGAEAWRVASALASAATPVILDPFAALPVNFDMVGATPENAARLHRAGVAIAFSFREDSSNTFNNARKLRQAAGNAVAHGLPYEAALAAITRVPAEIFGVRGEAGTIEVGRLADLVLWSGDPLEVTSAAERVFVRGHTHSMRSRQTELRDRYLPRELAR